MTILSAFDETGSGLGDPVLLDKIDKLFACNVGKYIDLPQLIVVGDQSSGKSSVLEALTELPFPRDMGLCTRFATQIIFRRAEHKKLTIFIIPSNDASPEHKDACNAWFKNDIVNLDAKTFGHIMQEATQVMGVSTDIKSEGQKSFTFSKDILKLELAGPRCEHLSVIDIPGLFQSATDGKTTKQDIAMVREMVLGYMRNPRSVMLTVVPANVDLATQGILQLARDEDPRGERTLGILTKPDLVEQGTELPIMDLLNGRSHAQNLGWHILHNPGQSALGKSSSTRHKDEIKFFNDNDPWNTIDSDKIGVKTLRLRLQRILANHIKREFPKVRLELQKNLADCHKQLEDVGEARDSPREQLKYPHNIAKKFEQLTSMALKTEYAHSEVFNDRPELKIATMGRNRSELFAKMMSHLGQTYKFVGIGAKTETNGVVLQRPAHRVRFQQIAEPVEEFFADSTNPVDSPIERGVMDWLKELYHRSRGFELGTFQASILANSMNLSSGKWDALAYGYISDVIYDVHNFVCTLLEAVCPDKHVRDNLYLALYDELLERYKTSIDHVAFLLHVERKEDPGTVADHFARELNDRRDHKRRDLIALLTGKRDDDKSPPPPPTTEEQMIQEIHDILASYYVVACKRFTDSVVMQVGRYHLTTGPKSPLKLFDSDFVDGLTDEQLEDIAGEDPNCKARRQQLLKRLEDLEAGRKILR